MATPVQIKVDGMSCGGCSSRLEKALSGIPGVTHVSADHATGEVTVETAGADIPLSALETVIEDSGFDVRRS
ncbi:heavy-metal-associated domain-containing protein [Swaminathania salitolerans]|uniref:HMA domain-containing protein n=1 Tax=Swaminathania salitolerans TaxID=182838 RepID=A0A511BN52_9PROT|nr:heavy metal-associated domain-containing protein [Swaminathania salitolerans]GBQ13745.1 cation/copper resistance transporter ATPase CopZ [Swaminathania salitolerans LMG 21291]GEL01751.1 hypothetical protein SSA02_09140 [Swaminathania salitolerans]